MPAGFESWSKVPGKLLKIALSSPRNLREAVNSNEAHVAFDAWFCGDKNMKPLYMPIVYDSKGLLGEDRTSAADQSKTIWVFLPQSAGASSGVQPGASVPTYDLEAEPRDVCIRVRALNVAGKGFISRVVRVTATDIAASKSAESARRK